MPNIKSLCVSYGSKVMAKVLKGFFATESQTDRTKTIRPKFHSRGQKMCVFSFIASHIGNLFMTRLCSSLNQINDIKTILNLVGSDLIFD